MALQGPRNMKQTIFTYISVSSYLTPETFHFWISNKEFIYLNFMMENQHSWLLNRHSMSKADLRYVIKELGQWKVLQ